MTHASTPFAHRISAGNSWLYFTSRDRSNRSHIGRIPIDGRSLKVDWDRLQLVLAPGAAGSFDDQGVSMGCIEGDFLYYMGWGRESGRPFCNAIGVALWNSDRWEKVGDGPVIGKSNTDPHTVSYPFVSCENGIYRMWYGSHLQWDPMRHVIKYAESKDGIQWKVTDQVCIPLIHSKELGVSRPFVKKVSGGYRMYYSYRGEASPYRIGVASSEDGIHWKRQDQSIDLEGCYPALLGNWLLYCDIQYGKKGCFARLVD